MAQSVLEPVEWDELFALADTSGSMLSLLQDEGWHPFMNTISFPNQQLGVPIPGFTASPRGEMPSICGIFKL